MCLNDGNRCGIRNSLKRWAVLYLSRKINYRYLSLCTSLTVTLVLVLFIVFGAGCSSGGQIISICLPSLVLFLTTMALLIVDNLLKVPIIEECKQVNLTFLGVN